MNNDINNNPEKSKKKLASKVIIIFLAVVFIILGVFFLYDSPAKYVPTQDGNVYINSDGEPILYYTDLFRHTFYEENGKRVYAAVPVYVDNQPLTTNAVSDEVSSQRESTTAKE